jgi:hypothetical protein
MGRDSKPKSRGGRPIDKVTSFGTRILSLRMGCTDRHARRILSADGPESLSSRDWYAVAIAIEDGIAHPDALEKELRRLHYL